MPTVAVRGLRSDGAEPRIWASVIRGLILPMEELQLSPAALLTECGIPAELLEKSQQSIPIRKYLQFLSLASEQSGDPLIGVNLARSAGPETLGPLGFLFLASQSLVSALSQFCSYINLLQDVTHVQFTLDNESLQFSYDIAPFEGLEGRHDVEFSLALMCRLIRMYAGSSIPFEVVRFRHAPAASISEYQRLMRTEVEFEQPVNCVVLSISAAKLKGHHFDPELANILVEMLDEQLSRRNRYTSFSEHVYDQLFSVRSLGQVTAKSISESLGVSEATLNRRLRSESSSLGEILNRRRFELAKEYLANPGLETTKIAHLIGFSESASFTRAFKRWSGGVTPSRYRQVLMDKVKVGDSPESGRI